MHILIRSGHLREHDLERYYLGMIADETELAGLEEHILSCNKCARQADEIADYIDAIRAGACTLSESTYTAAG